MAMDLTTLRNRRAPIMVFLGTFAYDDPDKKYLMTIWEVRDMFFGTTTAWRINTGLC